MVWFLAQHLFNFSHVSSTSYIVPITLYITNLVLAPKPIYWHLKSPGYATGCDQLKQLNFYQGKILVNFNDFALVSQEQKFHNQVMTVAKSSCSQRPSRLHSSVKRILY